MQANIWQKKKSDISKPREELEPAAPTQLPAGQNENQQESSFHSTAKARSFDLQ